MIPINSSTPIISTTYISDLIYINARQAAGNYLTNTSYQFSIKPKVRYKRFMKETIKRSELEKIKLNIKNIKNELKTLNPLMISDARLIEAYKNELKLYVARLTPLQKKRPKLYLVN